MRIRTIKPDFFLHASLFDAEKESGLPLRVSFAGLWCAADRDGRFAWEPRRLGACILPYDGIDFSRVLDALTTRGFLEKYRSENKVFGWIPSFARHQFVNPREKASEIPDIASCEQIGIDDKPLRTRGARVRHASGTRATLFRGEGKGREWNGREQEGEGDGSSTPPVSGTPTAPDPGIRELGLQHPPEGRVAFKKPEAAELLMAVQKAGMPDVEASKFMDFYDSNGWRVGKNPMKSWKGAVGTWKARWEENRNGNRNFGPRNGSNETPGELFVAGRDDLRERIAATAAAQKLTMDGPVPV